MSWLTWGQILPAQEALLKSSRHVGERSWELSFLPHIRNF